MIPAKGMKIGIWQYMPQKIQKWGFNNFLRAGKSGVIYDFIYEGAGTTGREKCGAKDVGFWLFKDLPKNPNFKAFFDNCFSTLPLLPQSKSRRILVTGMFRSNRIAAFLLMVEKDLK